MQQVLPARAPSGNFSGFFPLLEDVMDDVAKAGDWVLVVEDVPHVRVVFGFSAEQEAKDYGGKEFPGLARIKRVGQLEKRRA